MFATRKRILFVLGVVFVVGAAGIAVTHGRNSGKISSKTPGGAALAADVDVATVVSEEITDWQSYSGRLEAVDKVDIRPLVPGTIVSVDIKDGALVKKGDPLFTIDPRPYVAALDQASAGLAAADARAAYATSDAARANRLLSNNAIAIRDYDEKQNAAREANANLKAARAALEAAKLNLEYTQIVAPVSGRVSRAELTVGNIVSAGANAPVLTSLVSVSPIYASFNVDEQTYLRYLSRDSGGTIPVTLGLADEEGYSRDGTVVSVDNHLDTSSGTIRVRARFNNPDGALVPGLYARVKVGGGLSHPAIMVGDTAIGTDQDKKYVLVVGIDDHVSYREITPGSLHDGLRVVTAGLRAGERIVVNGIQHTRPNDTVRVHTVDMVSAANSTKPVG
jgi:multidrug efflux system membrane fusion protein